MRKAATMPISVRATAVETSVTSKRSGNRLRVKNTAASAMTSITVRTRLMEEISLSLPLAIFFVTRAPIRPKSVPQTSPAATPKKADSRPVRGNRVQQARKKQLTICESAIARLEEQCAALDAEMEAHGSDAGKLAELYDRKQETEARLEEEMTRWEELSVQIEEA